MTQSDLPVGGVFDVEANTYLTGVGQLLTGIHDWRDCEGNYCVIHNPLRGPWSSWPTQWRSDRRIMERVCPCGVGHPVAEVAWRGRGVHGCCPCPCPCLPSPPQVIEGEIVVKEIGS